MDKQAMGYESKIMNLDLSDIPRAAKIHKALASELRLQILRVGLTNHHCVNEIAQMLNIPASTAALNIRVLEDAGLIITEQRPGTRGLSKICNRRIDNVYMTLSDPLCSEQAQVHYTSYSLPIGSYWDCNPCDYCGMLSTTGTIGRINYSQSFFDPGRLNAQLIWFRYGYLEYRVSTLAMVDMTPTSLRISFEACSEVANYNMDWPSDIYVSVNGHELGCWTCPGDFGDRHGTLTPEWWDQGATQYGALKTWTVDETGTALDGAHLSDTKIDDLHLADGDFFTLRIGVHKSAQNVGGINLFGHAFGDHPQDISVQVGYRIKAHRESNIDSIQESSD